jgi:hypothetical protein
MPKLYHDTVEGWQVPGQQAKTATRIDVPNAPVELAAWLNARVHIVEPIAELLGEDFDRSDPVGEAPPPPIATSPVAGDPSRCAACKARTIVATEAGAGKLAIARELDQVTAWIAELPELWALQRVAEALKDRTGQFSAAEQGGVQ